MTQSEAYIRRRIDGLPKALVADAVAAAMSKVGGTAALLSALNEAQLQRDKQRARRRLRSLVEATR